MEIALTLWRPFAIAFAGEAEEIRRMIRHLVFVTLLATAAHAQTWNSNAGGWNTGYGTVYGSFGVAMATQNMYNTMQLNLQRATMRQAMINKFGLAAVEKAERDAAAGKAAPASGAKATPGLESLPARVVRDYGKFKPDKKVSAAKLLADNLGGTPEEKELIKQLAVATKQAFEAEEATKGWRNNVAGALAFFLISNITIYNDAAEPSDEAAEALFQAINQTLDESPEFGKMSSKDKQTLYEVLIGFSGMPLAIYTEAKEQNDAQGLATARELSGKLIELVLKTSPANLRIENGAFKLGK